MYKFILPRLTLLAALKIAKGISPSKPTIPILAGVRLSFEPERVTFHATDLDCHFTASFEIPEVACSVRTAVVNARALFDAVKLAQGSFLTLELPDGGQSVTVLDEAGGQANLAVIAEGADFPTLPDDCGSPVASLPLCDLQEVLGQAAIAMADADTRFAIEGVKVELKESRLRAISTDGHRMVVAETNAQVVKVADLLLPASAVRALTQLPGNGLIDLIASEKRVEVSSGGCRVIAIQLEKAFPNWEGVIPRSSTHVARVHRTDLSRPLTQAIAFSPKKNRPSSRWDFTEGSLTIRAGQQDAGLAVTMSAGYHGETCSVGLNPSYIKSFLGVTGEADIVVSVTSPESAVVFRPAGQADRLTYVVMTQKI